MERQKRRYAIYRRPTAKPNRAECREPSRPSGVWELFEKLTKIPVVFLTVGANGYDDAEQRSAGSDAAGAAFHRAGVRPDRLVIKAADEVEPLSQRMADCLAYQRLEGT
jgi:hypothetical protein